MGYYTNYEIDYELPDVETTEKHKEFLKQCREARISIPTDVRTAFDLALELRDEQGIFTFIYRCEIINYFAPLETE